MGQTYLPIGTQIKFDTQTYRIVSYAGQGGAGLVYCAVNVDEKLGNRIAIRETFPSQNAFRLPNGDVVSTGPEGNLSGALWEYQERVKKALKNAAIAERTTFRVIIPFPDLYGPERPAYICLPADDEFEISSNQYVLMSDATLTGLPLHAYVEEYKASHSGAFPLRQIVDIMLSVCEVVKHLHNGDEDGKRLLHGDISYGNIFLSDCDPVAGNCGIARLLDFGESRELKNPSGTVWETDEIGLSDPLGSTSGFMPPEVYNRKNRKDSLKLTAAVDTYALGYLLLSLVKGVGEHAPNYLYSVHFLNWITNSDRKRLTASKSAQILLNRIIDKALQNDCLKRYQNGQGLLADLRRLHDVVGNPDGPFHNAEIDRDILRAHVEHYYMQHAKHLRTQHVPQLVSALPKTYFNIQAKNSAGELVPALQYLTKQFLSTPGKAILVSSDAGAGKTMLINKLFAVLLGEKQIIPVRIDCYTLNQKASPVLATAVAKTYLHSNLAETVSQIDALFHAPDSGVLLILDNYNQVESPVLQQVLHELAHMRNVGNIRCLISGRVGAENLSPLFDIDLISLCAVQTDTILDLLKCTVERPLKRSEEDYARQATWLRIPLLLMRFLELVKMNPDLNFALDRLIFSSLPMELAVLHNYFNGELTSAPYNTTGLAEAFGERQELTDILPRIAWYSMAKRLKTLTVEELSARVFPHAKPVRLQAILSSLTERGILDEVDTGTYQFSHDRYCDYFAAFYIALILSKAIAEDNVKELERIDAEWADCTLEYSFHLCRIFFDQLYGMGIASEEMYEILFQLLDSTEALFCELSMFARNMGTFHTLAALAYTSAHRKLPSSSVKINLAINRVMAKLGESQAAERLLWEFYNSPALACSEVSSLFDSKCSTRDIPSKLQKIKELASADNPHAQLCLGLCKENGIGVPKDEPGAVYCYTAASVKGNADATCCLGVCTFYGIGTKEDTGRAYELLNSASDAGNARARRIIGQLTDWEFDSEKEIAWYSVPAKQGDMISKYLFATACLRGDVPGVDVDYAIQELKTSAESGIRYAQGDLFEMFAFGQLYGTKIKRNGHEAKYWLQKYNSAGGSKGRIPMRLLLVGGVNYKLSFQKGNTVIAENVRREAVKFHLLDQFEYEGETIVAMESGDIDIPNTPDLDGGIVYFFKRVSNEDGSDVRFLALDAKEEDIISQFFWDKHPDSVEDQ